jgi:hypothetical protein
VTALADPQCVDYALLWISRHAPTRARGIVYQSVLHTRCMYMFQMHQCLRNKVIVPGQLCRTCWFRLP